MRYTNLLKTTTLLFAGAAVLLGLAVGGCAQPSVNGDQPSVKEKPTIKLVEFDWSSQQFLTGLLDRIISEQLGYQTTRQFLSQPVTWTAMDRGDVDITPEIWFPARQAEIQPFLDKGNIELAGEIFGGAGNYWVVPKYVVEGDAARGIAPMAPDLKTILDLKKYWELFENPENPGKGELVGGEVGWLDESPWMILGYDLPLWKSNQSESVMLARLIAADKRGEPILAVIWSPHVIFSQVDLIKLESVDPPRLEQIDWDKDPFPLKTGLAKYTVHKVIRVELKETAPDVYRLVHNMSFSEDEMNALTFRVDVNGEEPADVARDWMSKNQSRIDQWLGK